MYVYVKPLLADGRLTPNEDIFPRPCPWAVAWEATFLALLGRSPYKMVFIPHCYAKELYRYTITQQGQRVVLSQNGGEVARFDIEPITWAMGFEYDVQSFLYGFFLRFWEWRWNEFGRLTNGELAQKLASMEERLDQYVERRQSAIIEQEDED